MKYFTEIKIKENYKGYFLIMESGKRLYKLIPDIADKLKINPNKLKKDLINKFNGEYEHCDFNVYFGSYMWAYKAKKWLSRKYLSERGLKNNGGI